MRLLALLFAVLALALAGCGGDDEASGGGGGGGGGTTIALASPEDGSLEFDKTELTAKAGEIKLDYDNPSSTPHAVEIEGESAQTGQVTAGKASLTADLEPGTYTYFCPVGNHRDAGMEGTLTVE